MENQIVTVISHIGFVLWFIAGIKVGMTMERKRQLKKRIQDMQES